MVNQEEEEGDEGNDLEDEEDDTVELLKLYLLMTSCAQTRQLSLTAVRVSQDGFDGTDNCVCPVLSPPVPTLQEGRREGGNRTDEERREGERGGGREVHVHCTCISCRS